MADSTLTSEYSKTIPDKIKHIVCIYLAFFAIVQISFSQGSSTIFADEKTVWDDSTASDEARLDDLIHQTLLHLEKGEFENSMVYINKIPDFELGREDPKYQSFYIFGQALFISYQDSNKLTELQKSIDLAKSIDYKLVQSTGYTFAGLYYQNQGDEKKAFEQWEKAIDISNNSDDYHLVINNGWTEIQVAMMMIRQGKEEEGEKYATEALRTFRNIPDEPAIYFGYYELGMTYQNLDRYTEAIAYFHKAIPLTPKGNPFIHRELANIYEAQGDWPKALKNYEYCHQQYLAMNRPRLAYGIMGDLGRVHVKLGQLDKATTLAEELLLDAKKERPLEAKFKVYILLGDIALAQGKNNLAIEHYQHSLALQKEGGNQSRYWPSHSNLELGKAYLRQGKYDKVIEHCLACESYFESNEDFVEQEVVYETLATAYKKSGNYKKALENAEKIIALKKDEDPLTTAKKLQEYEFSKKTLTDSLRQVERLYDVEIAHQTALRASNKSKFIAFGVGGLILLISLGLWNRLNYIRRSKKQLEEKNIIIEAEKEKAKNSENAKQQFLANMSHEIRTPMNAIKGMTDILLRREPQPQQLSYLNAIKESSSSLLVIINDILDISKIEAGKIDLEEIPFSLTEVIQNVNMIMQFKAQEKGLLLQSNISKSLPSSVIGDPTRLHQILLNLTGNAIKFTEKGLVTIQLNIKKSGDDKILANFCVSDTGVGIGKDRLNKIFDSFEQAYSDTTRKFGGTGLGLSISKKLVAIQNGKIWVTSEKGKGSKFHFSIPYEVSTAQPNPTVEHAPTLLCNTSDQLRNIKLLLVEDNQFNAIVAQEELEDAIPNIRIEVAENGAIAVEKHSHGSYDIILMDVQMPIMNGYDATMKIRKLKTEKASTPIIAMTANVMKDEVKRCYAAGMNDFIGKPFDVDDLTNKIYTLLDNDTLTQPLDN